MNSSIHAARRLRPGPESSLLRSGSLCKMVQLATAKTHVGRLLAKLGARDRAQLVMVAYETGLVQAG